VGLLLRLLLVLCLLLMLWLLHVLAPLGAWGHLQAVRMICCKLVAT
jgi:hypothetical protein